MSVAGLIIDKSSPMLARLWQYREPAFIFAATRTGLFLLVFVGQVLIPGRAGTGPGVFPGNLSLDGLTRWDGGWYLSIVRDGYTYDAQTHLGSVAFFPLYPIVMRLATYAVGNTALAGILVANLCFLMALVLLYDLVKARTDQQVARRTVLGVCAFPFAFYFSAIYTESLFLFLAVLSFWFAERGRWWLAGFAGMLCALTRLVGIGLALAIVLLYVRDRGYRLKRGDWRVLSAGLVPLGTGLFMAYLWIRFGDPLAFAKASLQGWHNYSIWISGLERLNPATFGPGNYNLVQLANLSLAVIWLLAVLYSFRVLGPGYGAFGLLAVVVPLFSQVDSLGRYMSIVFPAFAVWAYCLRRPVLFKLTLGMSAMILGLLTVLFANQYWVV